MTLFLCNLINRVCSKECFIIKNNASSEVPLLSLNILKIVGKRFFIKFILVIFVLSN